jgi:Flp pilus assembly protein TadG
MKKPNKSRIVQPKRQGIAFIWAIIFLLTLILVLGLTLDTAKVFLVSHQLQNAADAAALAGVRVIKEDPNGARQIAMDIALANFADGDNVQLGENIGNDPNGDIVLGRYTMSTSTFTSVYNKTPNALKVVARRTNTSLGGSVPLNFGPIVEVDTANVSRFAIAKVSGGTGAGLIALSPDETGLRLSGGINLDVNDGAIQINSEIDPPVIVSGSSGNIDADEINIVSEYELKGDWPENVDVDYEQPPIPDPLAWMDPPTWDEAEDKSPSPGELIDANYIELHPGSLSPGYYSGGFRFTRGDVVLEPGIYILDGSSTGQKSGLYINGGNFTAEGVMFYIIGDGVVYLGGNGEIIITELFPMDSGEYYEGMSIFQARDNYNDATIIGNNTMDLTGTLYFPENHVELGGIGIGLGNQFIADTIWMHGTGTFTINYDGRNMAAGGSVYLVE